MRRGVKGRCPTVLTVLSALLSGPEPRDMSQWHWSSVTPSDLRGQKETQDTEGSLGRKRDALTALSVPYSLFCPKEPFADLLQPLLSQGPSWVCQLSHPQGEYPSGAWVKEANTHPSFCKDPSSSPGFLKGDKSSGPPFCTPGGGWVLCSPHRAWDSQSPRSHFPPLSRGQAWEKPGSSNAPGG